MAAGVPAFKPSFQPAAGGRLRKTDPFQKPHITHLHLIGQNLDTWPQVAAECCVATDSTKNYDSVIAQ